MENTKLIFIETTLNGTFHSINSMCIKYNIVLLFFLFAVRFVEIVSFWRFAIVE